MTQQEEANVRREIVHHLLEAGLSVLDISRTLDIDPQTVQNDFKGLGGKKAYPTLAMSQTERTGKSFAAALHMYASLITKRKRAITVLDEARSGLIQALENYLDVKHLLIVSEGLASMIQLLCNPADPPEYRAHRFLLQVLFGLQTEIVSGDKLFKNFLMEVRGDMTINRKSFSNTMSAWAIERYQDRFSTPLNEKVILAVDQVLEELTEREAEIVRLHFGIGRTRELFEQIAARFELNRVRIRQIEAKAFRRLRNPSRSDSLLPFVSSKTSAQRFIEWRFPDPPPPPKPEVPDLIRESLSIPIEELDTRDRTRKTLLAENITTLLELVQKTEEEILKIPNLGKRELGELRDELFRRGLRFGMKFE